MCTICRFNENDLVFVRVVQRKSFIGFDRKVILSQANFQGVEGGIATVYLSNEIGPTKTILSCAASRDENRAVVYRDRYNLFRNSFAPEGGWQRPGSQKSRVL